MKLVIINIILFFIKRGGKSIAFWCFDTDFISITIQDGYHYFNKGLGTSVGFFQYDTVFNKWVKIDNLSDVSTYNSDLIYSSDSLLQYRDILVSGEFVLDLSRLEVTTCTLYPIIEEQKISSVDVFGEVFDLFSVLMIVFISIVGIKKAINWLLNLLRCS